MRPYVFLIDNAARYHQIRIADVTSATRWCSVNKIPDRSARYVSGFIRREKKDRSRLSRLTEAN